MLENHCNISCEKIDQICREDIKVQLIWWTGIDLKFLEIDLETYTCFDILTRKFGYRYWCSHKPNHIYGFYPFTPIQHSFGKKIIQNPNLKHPKKRNIWQQVVECGCCTVFCRACVSSIHKKFSLTLSGMHKPSLYKTVVVTWAPKKVDGMIDVVRCDIVIISGRIGLVHHGYPSQSTCGYVNLVLGLCGN